jgi:hypothetical protein
MKEQLVQLLKERVGLDDAKANQAIDTVMGFVKENPERLQELLGNEQLSEMLGKLPGGLGGKVNKLFG